MNRKKIPPRLIVAKKLASATIDIAMAESLSAHALVVKIRLEK